MSSLDKYQEPADETAALKEKLEEVLLLTKCHQQLNNLQSEDPELILRALAVAAAMNRLTSAWPNILENPREFNASPSTESSSSRLEISPLKNSSNKQFAIGKIFKRKLPMKNRCTVTDEKLRIIWKFVEGMNLWEYTAGNSIWDILAMHSQLELAPITLRTTFPKLAQRAGYSKNKTIFRDGEFNHFIAKYVEAKIEKVKRNVRLPGELKYGIKTFVREELHNYANETTETSMIVVDEYAEEVDLGRLMTRSMTKSLRS